MDFLFQLFADAVEAESSRTFQQDEFVVQIGELPAGEELFRRFEECFFSHMESICTSRHLGSNAEELPDAALFQQRCSCCPARLPM